jgi:Rad3-related DNA helicase
LIFVTSEATMPHTQILKFFPRDKYADMTSNQGAALDFLGRHIGETNIIEAPTGTGKTVIGYTWLASQGVGVKFYLVPNKTLVGQVAKLHPDMSPMFGRNEHDCLYYEETFKADQVPCSMLSCGHRVSLVTGETQDPHATPCPYLLQRYEAQKSSTIIATYAFYLYAVFYGGKGNSLTPSAVVLDEAHGIAKSMRSSLVFRISDRKMKRIVSALEKLNSKYVDDLERFMCEMSLLAKKRKSNTVDRDAVLSFEEIQGLLTVVEMVNTNKIQEELAKALSEGLLDVTKDREALNQLSTVTRDLKHYIRALKFSLPPTPVEETKRRNPLSYAYAYWEQKEDDGESSYELVIKDYYVAGLIRTMLPKNTLAYSATIIDPDVLAIETGLSGNFLKLGSDFPVENTKIFMPSDAEDLSVKGRSNRSLPKTIRRIVRSAKAFADKGKRSLIVVVSDVERAKVLTFAKEEGLHALSYGNGVSARVVAQRFRDGEGDCLVGTVTNYGEGVDLPDGIAPIIFCLRPSYPNPNDPQTFFEETRYGQARWKIWNWRVMIDLLQVRGRNVRSISDKGVTVLMSQQFRRFAKSALPEWLRPAYVNHLPFDVCLSETEKII